jgi:hypothetical protein
LERVSQFIAIEVKSVGALHAVHIAQAVSYLRLTRTRVALVVNFNVSVLKQEFGESCCESVFVPSGLHDERVQR